MSAQEDWEELKRLADRLFDDDDDEGKENYISKHMKRFGHKMRTAWEDSEPEGNSSGDDDDFFGRRRQRRDVPDSRSGGRSKGRDWQYGS
jgi:hypothetical protein